MVFIQCIRHGFRFPPEQQVGQIAGLFSSGGHGPDTADAVYNHIMAGELFCPETDAPLHLRVGDRALEIVAAADGGGPAEGRFRDFDVHFPQKAPDGLMDLGLMPVAARVVDRDRQAAVVRQF